MMKRRRKYSDRLSDLPDCILLHILSFLDAKEAIQTCMLSKRWKNIWKCLSILTLTSRSNRDFPTFISKILSLRDASAALHVIDIYHDRYIIEPQLLEGILKYAFSHNVQQLQIRVHCCIQQFPPSFFSCHTLTSLSLHFNYSCHTLLPNFLNFPALTNLSLRNFVFHTDDDSGHVHPFSTLNRLNSLIIKDCIVSDEQKLCISSATLVNLTIQTIYYDTRILNFQLFTPNLVTFVYSGTPLQKLCGSMINLSSIKHVEIDVCGKSKSVDTALVLLNWLVELANIESLTVTKITLEVLSLVPDLLKAEFSSLYNLKSLKVKSSLIVIPEVIVNFLLQNSPSAKVLTAYID